MGHQSPVCTRPVPESAKWLWRRAVQSGIDKWRGGDDPSLEIVMPPDISPAHEGKVGLFPRAIPPTDNTINAAVPSRPPWPLFSCPYPSPSSPAPLISPRPPCSSQRSSRSSSSPSPEYGPSSRWPSVKLAMTGYVSGLVPRIRLKAVRPLNVLTVFPVAL